MYRCDGRREDLVRHYFSLAPGETGFKSLLPRQTQFRIDVNDVDSGADRQFQIFIRRAGTAVQSEGYTSRGFDFSNSLDRKMLSLPAGHHALAHAVRISNGGGKHVYLRLRDELTSLFGSGQCVVRTGTVRVNLRAAADVPDFSL